MYTNQDKKLFLDIYKDDNIQNEYIIWNTKTRDHLLSEIKAHFSHHIQLLINFSESSFNTVKVPGNLPLYTEKFSKVVKYEMLDREIKIGKFYAKTWVKNATTIQMTNEELNEFYQKVINLVKTNVDPSFLKASEENIDEGVENLILCIKMVIKLNDAFNYKKIINIELLDQVINLENKHQNKHNLWELFTCILEMIRKAMRWEDVLMLQSEYLVNKVEQILTIILDRVNQNGVSLVIAEALSEAMNITNIMISTYPEWIIS